jgi:membrane-associated phospholipid phosphatase
MPGHAYTAHAVSRSRAERPRKGSGAANALGVAAICVGAMALVWSVAELVPAVQLRDSVALYHFTLLDRPRIDGPAHMLVRMLEPDQFILWGIALVAIAVARERPRVAIAIALVMALAPFTAETLKPLLAHPHMQVDGVHVGEASWPSGHATAATALALAAVLVAPPRLRTAVAVAGVLFALTAGCALLILAWHMPSDVIGGYLVATLWGSLAVAALLAGDRRWPPRHSSLGA